MKTLAKCWVVCLVVIVAALKSVDLERILTYSDYRPAADGPYSVSR